MDRHSFTLALFGLVLIFSTAQAYVLYGGALYCNTTCADCEAALNNDSYNTVYLNSSLSSPGASCINNPTGFSNKIFDCQGNRITGNGNGNGIYLDSRTNDTIRNCSIEAFSNTLVLYRVSNSTISNLTLFNSSVDCADFYNITNTTIANSTAHSCAHEVMSLDYSTSNTIINNTLHGAEQQCIEGSSSDWNLITRNIIYDCMEGVDFHWFSACSYNTISYNNISDCNMGLSLRVADSGVSQHNVYANNTISTSTESMENGPPGSDVWPGQDVFIEAGDIALCDNTFQNNTGTGGLPIYFSNSAVSWSDFEASEIILCNADNSVLRNITVRSSNNTNGVMLYYSDNVTISDTSSIGHMYGFILYNSENNTLVNNIAYDNMIADLQFGQSYLSIDPRYCNNVVQNLTSSGGRQFYFTNETVAWSNLDLAGVILCNADNSVLNNITIRGSDSFQNNEFMMYLSDNVTVSSSFSIGNHHGFDILGGNNLTFVNNIAYDSYVYGFMTTEVTNSVFYNNTAYSNSGSGFSTYLDANNTITSNTAYDNAYVGFESFYANGVYSDNIAHDNAVWGFTIYASPNITFINNTAYDNGFDFTDPLFWGGYPYYSTSPYAGFSLVLSSNTIMRDNTAYGNNYYGIVANLSGDFNSTNDHAYDNGIADVYVAGAESTTINTYFTGLVIDSDSGRYSDYANLTITDELDADTAYTISWAGRPAELPTGLMSFEDKFVNITSVTGTTSIDSINWTWTNSEAADYAEPGFTLWEYSIGACTDTNASLNRTANKLSLSDLVPASVYAIFATAQDEEDHGDSKPRQEPECTYSSDCGLCGICSAGDCKPEGDCAADSDCGGNGYTCDSCFCAAPECSVDADCGGNGYTCSNYGCVAPECTRDSDCEGNGYTCSGYSCTAPECISDTQCPTGQVCTAYSCVAAPAPECTTDSECGTDESCSNSACTGITCDCGTVANHSCTHYECCADYDCADDYSCKNHACITDEVVPPVIPPVTPGKVPEEPAVVKNPPSAGGPLENPLVRASVAGLVVLAILAVFYLRARKTGAK